MRNHHRHYTPPPPLPLFEPPHSDVDTSWEAAAIIAPHAHRIRETVFAFIQARGEFGATEREIEHGLTLPGNTARPRLWELCGNAPKGQPRPPVRIVMTPRRRDRMRVYVCL